MEKVTWRTQIFSGFFLVLIFALALALIVALVMGVGLEPVIAGWFDKPDFGIGPWWVPLVVALVIILWIVIGNSQQEPREKREAYQKWLLEHGPTRLPDQY